MSKSMNVSVLKLMLNDVKRLTLKIILYNNHPINSMALLYVPPCPSHLSDI